MILTLLLYTMDYGKSILRAGFTGLFHEVYISYGTNPYLISYYPASLSFSNLLKKSAKSPPQTVRKPNSSLILSMLKRSCFLNFINFSHTKRACFLLIHQFTTFCLINEIKNIRTQHLVV